MSSHTIRLRGAATALSLDGMVEGGHDAGHRRAGEPGKRRADLLREIRKATRGPRVVRAAEEILRAWSVAVAQTAADRVHQQMLEQPALEWFNLRRHADRHQP